MTRLKVFAKDFIKGTAAMLFIGACAALYVGITQERAKMTRETLDIATHLQAQGKHVVNITRQDSAGHQACFLFQLEDGHSVTACKE